MLRRRLPTPSPPLLSVPNRRHSDLRCGLADCGTHAAAAQIADRRHRILGGFWVGPGSVMKEINRMVASVLRASQTYDRDLFLWSTTQLCVGHE